MFRRISQSRPPASCHVFRVFPQRSPRRKRILIPQFLRKAAAKNERHDRVRFRSHFQCAVLNKTAAVKITKSRRARVHGAVKEPGRTKISLPQSRQRSQSPAESCCNLRRSVAPHTISSRGPSGVRIRSGNGGVQPSEGGRRQGECNFHEVAVQFTPLSCDRPHRRTPSRLERGK